MGKFELRVLYARATTRLWEKIERLRKLPISISDFGTRRRHSFLWQDWCVEAMIEGLGIFCSSNCLIAMRRDIEAIGTNAHELPMVYAALAEDDAELRRGALRVLENWRQDYDGNLRIILPDTYGTEGVPQARPLRGSPPGPASASTRACRRRERRPPSPGGKARARTRARSWSSSPTASTSTASRRSTTASTTACRVSFGWGTLLTNDFRGLASGDALVLFSLVCKAVSANGRPNGRQALG